MPDEKERNHRLFPSQAYSFDFLCSEFWFALFLGFGLGWAFGTVMYQ